MDETTSHEATPSRGASAPSAANSQAFDPRDLIPTPLFCVSPQGRIVWMNAAAEALTGRHAAAVAGEPYSILFPEESRRKAARQVLGHNRRGVTEYYFETPIVTAGAESNWVGLHVRLATAANGRSAFVCAANDLHEIHANLETLSRRNRELTARLEEATAGAELKSTFLATMSSELRAPMNGVIGMTRLLLDSSLDGDQRMWAEVIQSSGDQLLNLVDDILDYSRIESGQLAIGSMDFDLRVTVDAVASLLATRAHQSGIQFSSLVHHRVPSLVNGDPGRVRQVLLHLAACALEQGEGGEVQVRVELVEESAHQAVVRFWVNRVGGVAEADPSTEDALFATYTGESLPEGASGRLGGRGLGLTIARRLVALMGGDVGTTRAGEMGNKLWFRIPLGKQAERLVTETATPASASARRNVATLRALVVDPDAASRAGIRETIVSWGATCDEAEGGLAAIERLKAAVGQGAPYGTVLVDLDVPELDAEAFARAVRADSALAALPLVLLTALGRPGDAARAESWGYDAYFVKPLEGAEVKAALTELLGREQGSTGLVTRHTVAELKKRRVRVLVVEDNPIDQLVIASALRRVGYTPEIAPSIEQATAAIGQQSADVVFVDVASAGDEGYARAASLRQACDQASNGGARIAIVALVGRVRDEEREQCRAAGIDDLLGKPVDLEALVATVGRWIEARGEETTTAGTVEEVPTTTWPVESPAASTALADSVAAPAAEPVPSIEVESTTPPPFEADTRAPWIESNQPLPEPEPVADSEWTPAPEPQPERHADALDALPVFDAACLDAASMGNAEIRGLLVDAFLTRTRQPLDRLKKAGEWKDAKAVEFQAHAMRGMCESVGAVRCGAALGRVEQWAADGHVDEAIDGIARVESELATVRAEWSVADGNGMARAA